MSLPQGICSHCKEGFMSCKCEQFHPNLIKAIIMGDRKLEIRNVDYTSEGMIIYLFEI